MKRTTAIRLFALLLIVLIAILPFIACSAAGNESADSIVPGEKVESSIGGAGNAMDYEDGVETSAGMADSAEPSDGEYERKIIRTVHMTAETKGFDKATTFLIDTLITCGGYTESSSISGMGYEGESGSARQATYTLRVPADKLDAFLQDIGGEEGIRILSQSAESSEITGTYYDLVTRMETLETERDALQSMLAGFTDYNDIDAMLQVQERLYNVIEEIEALQTRINLYDSQVELSTVHLTLREVVTYSPAKGVTFGERLGDAFKDSWESFAEGCQDFAVWLVYALPTLLLLFVIPGVVLVIVLVSVHRARKKRESNKNNKQE